MGVDLEKNCIHEKLKIKDSHLVFKNYYIHAFVLKIFKNYYQITLYKKNR